MKRFSANNLLVLFGLIVTFAPVNLSSAISYELLTGSQISKVTDFVITQRLGVFAKYPYLYRGTVAEELNYLSQFVFEPDSAVVVAYDQGVPVGFIAGTPLTVYEKIFPGSVMKFQEAGLAPVKIYYFSEEIVLEPYQPTGVVQSLYAKLEEFVKNQGFTSSCFVHESHIHHPLKPANYKEQDQFFELIGYRLTSISVDSNWQTYQFDGSTCDQKHVLTYWLKNLV